jgi:hypothetical protein
MKIGDSEHDPTSVMFRIKSEIELTSPIITMVFDHWANLTEVDGRIPDRRAISPDTLSTALAYVWLCDFDREVDRFRYRLAGEHVTSNLGSGVRGRYLDELTASDVYPRIHAYFRKCVDLPAALHVSGRIYAEQSRVAIGERVLLPYSDSTGEVTGILGATFRQWTDRDTPTVGDSNNDSRRHMYFHLSNGASEVEDFTLASARRWVGKA